MEKLHETKEWYDEKIAPDVTDEFESWWLEFYGPIVAGFFEDEELDVGSTEVEASYYIRKAFAWHGWNGRK